MRPSEWPWYQKLFAIVLTVALTAAFGWIVRQGAEALPVWLAGYVAVGMMSAAVGALFMERYMIRFFARHLGLPWRTVEAILRERERRRRTGNPLDD